MKVLSEQYRDVFRHYTRNI